MSHLASTKRQILEFELMVLGYPDNEDCPFQGDVLHMQFLIYEAQWDSPSFITRMETSLSFWGDEIIPKLLWGIPFDIEFRVATDTHYPGAPHLELMHFVFEEGLLL